MFYFGKEKYSNLGECARGRDGGRLARSIFRNETRDSVKSLPPMDDTLLLSTTIGENDIKSSHKLLTWPLDTMFFTTVLIRSEDRPAKNHARAASYFRTTLAPIVAAAAAAAAKCTRNKMSSSSSSSWLPDGYSRIFRIVCVWPFGLLDYGSATLRCKI